VLEHLIPLWKVHGYAVAKGRMRSTDTGCIQFPSMWSHGELNKVLVVRKEIFKLISTAAGTSLMACCTFDYAILT
jgi:hypothetical protein